MPRNFKESTADLFISAKTPAKKSKKTEPEAPKGYKLVPEYKSERLNLLIKPSVKADLKELAAKDGTSVNDLINKVLEEYVKGRA